MVIYFTFYGQGNKPFGFLINHLSSEDLYIGIIIDSSFSSYGELIKEQNLKDLIKKFFNINGGIDNLSIGKKPLIGEADFKNELIEILDLIKK